VREPLANHLPEGRLKRMERWIYAHWRRLLIWGFVAMFLTSVLTAYFGWRALTDFKEASLERRNQNCVTDERRDRDEVAQLKRIYQALESQTLRAQLGVGLVRLVVVQLPQTEKAARSVDAPPYCAEDGVGLKFDPDLDNPPKRRDFTYLLAPSHDPP